MIRFVVFIFIVFSSMVCGQKSALLVEYQYSYITLNNLTAFLVADENQSVFFFSKNPNSSYLAEESNNFADVNPFFLYFYDVKNDWFYQRTKLMRESRKRNPKLAMDQLPDINWEVKKETRTILGFRSYLAEGDFRGRKYKVWFTPEIAASAFPLKLKGLPGVILEFEDTENFVKAAATKVAIGAPVIFPKKIMDFLSENREAALPYQEFIKMENEMLSEFVQEEISSMPKGTRFVLSPLREMSLEKTFEWDAETKEP